jgi:ubiquinone biosynthesis protein COQ4
MKRVLLSIRERVRSVWIWARGWAAALLLLKDPNDLDEVFMLDRAMPRAELDEILRTARLHPTGRSALVDRPRVEIDLPCLREMQRGTFGRSVADFFDANRLDPTSIPKVDVTDDGTYAHAHLYETHDLWHVALGFGTTVSEELGLQAVYAAQLPGKLAPILIAGGLLQASLWVQGDFAARLAAVSRGYALGKQCLPLFGVRWNDLWGLRLEDVRERLGVEGRATTLPASPLALA